ncbi:MAG: HAD-IA family hydrolase [Clostridiales bacterium]|nr:HAD-IA family hydrolase [Clostridiales bacterium]
MRFSLLLCDIDNTIFDFRSAERAAYAAVAARFSLPGDEELFALYKAINSFHWQKLRRGETTSARLRLDRFRDFMDAQGIENADIQAMSDYYVQILGQQSIPVEGAEAFLRRVSKHMSVVLVTNGFAAVQRLRMRGSPLRQYIRDILVSEEFANAKPHPEMLLEAMKHAGVTDPAQAVMIGDNEDTDILAAKNAGTKSVLFTLGAPPPEHTKADFVAATLKEAADYILSD